MVTMRQITLECTDQGRIDEFLNVSKTGYLGLADDSYPYVVPLNYVWMDGTIYFHGASEGRKVDILEKNPQACFTVSADFGTMTHPVPAKTDTAFMSVMIFGQAEKVENLDESVQAMQKMLDKYVPGYYEKLLASSHVDKYRSSLGSKTAVYKIPAAELTAKENPLHQEKRFYEGKTTVNDISK